MTPTQLLSALAGALRTGGIRVIDLTQTLTPEFPQIALPPEMGQCWPFRIEEVSRYDSFVNEARMNRQKHFAERAEGSIRRLQGQGNADPEIDPEIASVALGSMVGRFAELWLVEGWGKYDFDTAAEQLTKLWANAIGLRPTSG